MDPAPKSLPAADPDAARLERYIAAQRRSLLEHEPGVRLGADPEDLHQFRVAARRLRAALRVARPFVAPEPAAELRAELGALARAGGPVRDLEVLISTLERDAATLDDPEREAGQAVLLALAAERDGRRETLVTLLAATPYARLVDRLSASIDRGQRTHGRSLRKLANRNLRRLVRSAERLGGEPGERELHELRIRVKRARYSVELAGETTGARGKRVVAAARALQDVLGEHQDAVIAERLLHELAERVPDPAVAFVAGRLAERQRLRRERLRERVPSALRRLRRAAR